TYASFRIRGSIMDGLRKEDWLPRTIREKTKKIEHVSQKLEQHLHRTPSAAEIGDKAGLTQQEVETHVKDALFANILSIEEKPAGSTEDIKEGIGYTLPDETAVLPDVHLENTEWKQELATGIQ